MRIINKVIPLLLVLLTAGSNTHAQSALEKYIKIALTNNQGLKEQMFQLDKSIFALREARSLFLPSVSLQGDYTRAKGGRAIELPLGNLLNPAYSTLNQLTNSDRFPTLKNESIQMNPDNYYDIKLHTTMPLINAEIYYNKQIKKQVISLRQASVNIYKRALVKDIKVAYFLYYQAEKSVLIYNDALKLVEKSVSVNEKLLNNGVSNGAALARAQTERTKVIAQISFAENKSKNAKAYFNFLLNRDLEAAIEIDSICADNFHFQTNTLSDDAALSQREELRQLSVNKDIQMLNRKLEQSYIVPKVSTFLNAGSQGFNWAVNSQSRYYLLGVNLQWDLFSWNKHKYRIQQSQMDINTAAIQFEQAEKAFRLALTQSLNDYNSAVSNYYTAQSQKQYAEKYYTDQSKAYKAGQLLYIELIDAQNQLTNAQMQVAIAFANVQIAMAESERNLASYPLN